MRRHRSSEAGYMLISMMIMLAIFIILMAVGAPKVADSIKRDREVETMRRGKQYIRAIQLYYRKFHSYPPNMDALVKTNEIRFLRKRYLDPMTGKDDWKPILFGQNKTPMAMGFFGQPLGGTGGAMLAGTGPSGGSGIGGASVMNAANSGTSGSIFSNTGAAGGTGSSAGAAAADANGTPTNGTASPVGAGPTFGGGGIIGVSPASPKPSVLIYKKKSHFNEWEFLYSPLIDQQMVSGGNAGTIGQPSSGPSGTSQNGAGGIGGAGGGIGGSGVNQPGNNGSTPILPPPSEPPSTTPQQ